MRRAVFLIFGVIMTILVITGCGPRQGVVAKAGKYTITADELNMTMASARFKSFDEEFEARKKRVEDLANRKLYLLAAYEEKLDKKPELKERVENEKSRFLLQALDTIEIIEKIGEPTEEEIQAVYERLKEILHVKHIAVRSKETADSIYAMLQSGKNFDSLAAQYSIDTRTKGRGGDLGEFSATMFPKEFEDASYALSVGEISKPVQTWYAWHIIMLVERKPNPNVKPYEDEKDRLKQNIRATKIGERRRQFDEELFNSANLKYNEAAVAKIVQIYSTPQQQPQGQPQQQPIISESDKRIELFTYKYGTWTIGIFDSVYKALPPFNRMPLETQDNVKDFVKRIISRELKEKAAQERNIESTPEYKKYYNASLEMKMVDEFQRNYMLKDIEPKDDEVLAYYQANPDSFMEDEQVQVLEIQVDTEDEAKKILGRINKGEDFGKLASKYTKRAISKDKNGDLGFFTERQRQPLFNAAKTLKKGEVYPQPIPYEGKFSIIKLVDTKGRELKPFESVQRIIKNKLRSQKRSKAIDDWLATARKKYGYKIYEEEIKKTIDKSKYEKAQPKPAT